MIVWNEFLNDARVLKEAETLQFAGHKVTVHALHTPGVTLEKEKLPSGVLVKRISRSPLWKLRKHKIPSATQENKNTSSKGAIGKISSSRQVLRITARLMTHLGLVISMIKSQPDVVHSHDVNTLPTAWIVSVFMRSPLVYDAHEISTDREGYASFRKLVGWVEKHLIPRVAGMITTTDLRAKFFARAYGVTRPIVLQNRPAYQEVKKSNRIRDELGLKQLWPIVIYQGGLQQGRGLERLVNAAAQVNEAYFVFIGSGRMESILKEQVRALHLAERIHFIPTVSLIDLPSYTASGDIGVQPIENTCLNHFSTDSNKLFEYIIAGLPVVTSNLPEIRKIVNEYKIGLLTNPGNTEELIQSLRTLVSDLGLRKEYSDNAKLAAKQLNWDTQQYKLTALYEQLTP